MSFPYSSQSHTTVNSTTTSFSYSDVPLLADVPHKDQLRVYENGQLRTFNVTGADNYILNTTSELVVFNSARASGVTIKITRVTDIENKEVTFTNSSVLTAQDLNKNSDQLLFLCQELYDKAQDISLTATGGIPPNSIGSSQLISDAGNEAVTTSVIRDDAVTTAKIDDNAVTTAKIDDNAVTTAKIDDDAVTTAKILDLNVTTGKINNLAVTTGKIDDLAVTTGKINNLAVTTGKIDDLAVTTPKLGNNSVTTAKLDVSVPYLKNGGTSIGSVVTVMGAANTNYTVPGTSAQTWFYWVTFDTRNTGSFSISYTGVNIGGHVIAAPNNTYSPSGFAIRLG